ncbi:hypothetical protein HDE_00903 [Halotydeus destructor]|nr:hypothetical protein HDE_00903 [Halotydeus destructor]
MLLNSDSPETGRVTKQSHRFSLWTLATCLMLQSAYDPVDKTRRLMFINNLLLVFLLNSVAWSYVGTKRVVTQSPIARSLSDLHALNVSTGLFINGNDWPVAKFKDPGFNMAHKIYKRNCEPREKDCIFDVDQLISMLEYLSSHKFAVICEQSATEMLSRYFCGSSLELTYQRQLFSSLILNEIQESSDRIYKDIFNLVALKIVESGLSTAILMQLGIDYDEEVLVSWRTCAMTETLDLIGDEFRQITTNDFSLMWNLVNVVLFIALLLHVMACCQRRGRAQYRQIRRFRRHYFVHRHLVVISRP